jgi:hypothetical protein
MTLRQRRDLALAACVTSIIFCSDAAAQTLVDEWFSVKTGPAAVLLDPSSSSVVVATAARGTVVRAQRLQDGWYLVSLPKAADELAPLSGWLPAAMLTRVKVEMPVGTSGQIEPYLQPAGSPVTSAERARGSWLHDARFQADPVETTIQSRRIAPAAAVTLDAPDRTIAAAEPPAEISSAAMTEMPRMPTNPSVIEYRVLATSKTSTMQREMQEAADAGFRFGDVMGGNTAFGGSEVVVIMQRGGSPGGFSYRLLATGKTSTMQKEMQEAGDAGFEYCGQTVFKSAFGGKEVVAILERSGGAENIVKYEYRLLAASKTSTIEKELREAGDQAFEFVGMTIARTLAGGEEVVAILRRKL